VNRRRQTRDDALLVDDILDSAARIARVVARGYERFEADEEQQDIAERRLEVIGEAVKLFSQEFIEAHPELPIIEAGGQRDFIIHEYWKTKAETLWGTMTEDVPAFATQLLSIKQATEL